MPKSIEKGTYLEGLLKNIPSEAIGSYLAVLSFLTAVPNGPPGWLQWVLFVVFLGTVPLWLVLGPSKVKWWQVLFAALSFFIWVMTLQQGPFGTISGYEAWIGGVLVLVFSGVVFPLLSKLIVKLSS